MLVASRILQGGMAALMVPQVLSIVHATFPAHERGKVFGLFGAVVGLGAVSGPLLGALLTEWNLFGLRVAARSSSSTCPSASRACPRQPLHHRVQGAARPEAGPGRASPW